MQIHFNKMSDAQKLEWLKTYERQNPAKYLMKYGKVTGTVPMGQPFAGQPNKWDYVAPEEAIKKISPSYAAGSSLKVEISEKENVKQELDFTPEPDATPEVKRGRKPKNV